MISHRFPAALLFFASLALAASVSPAKAAEADAVADFLGALDAAEAELSDGSLLDSDDPEIPVTPSGIRMQFRSSCLSVASVFSVRTELVPGPAGSLLRHTYECASRNPFDSGFRLERFVLHLEPPQFRGPVPRLQGLEVYRANALVRPAVMGISMGVGVLASMKASNAVYGAPDKLMHAVAGSLISSTTSLVSYYGLRLNAWQSVGIGLGASMAAGLAKEYIYDRRTPGHTVDFQDFVATAMGGAIASVSLTIPLSAFGSNRRSRATYRSPRFVSPPQIPSPASAQ